MFDAAHISEHNLAITQSVLQALQWADDLAPHEQQLLHDAERYVYLERRRRAEISANRIELASGLR